jgi:hydroxyethylthiazole kinase-like uncharacterized protein yjeF
MKILNAAQIREADAFTIQEEGIDSHDLMERAANKCTEWMLNHLGYSHPFVILCGPGNNGGDGLAIGRQLHHRGMQVNVLILPAEKYSADNLKNQEALKTAGVSLEPLTSEKIIQFEGEGVVWIDALLGSGAREVVDHALIEIIDAVNATKGLCISVDIPSGLMAEAVPESRSTIICADVTLCFHKPRLSFFFEESAAFLGHWEVLDIGIIEPENFPTSIYFTGLSEARQLLYKRHPFAHKGTFGHVLLAGGSAEKAGAVILSARAALRSGAGKATALIPQIALTPVQSAVPEAMCIASESETHLSGSINPEHFDALAFGMGAGTHDDTARLLKILIQNSPVPLLLDADALNILSENKTWLAFLPALTILTPHPGEFDRIAGKSANSFERWQKARALAVKSGSIVILKGAYTRICLPNGITYFNGSGNAGMATAGSGDVLSGVIAALLAQGYSPENAAILGVFAHGLAGDFASEHIGSMGMLAGDIIEHLPKAWKRIGGVFKGV